MESPASCVPKSRTKVVNNLCIYNRCWGLLMKKSTIKLGEGEIDFSLTFITKTHLFHLPPFPSLFPQEGRMKTRGRKNVFHKSLAKHTTRQGGIIIDWWGKLPRTSMVLETVFRTTLFNITSLRQVMAILANNLFQ